MIYKRVRKYIHTFLTLVMILVLLNPFTVNAATSHKNAYLNCYFDEATCSYQYKIMVSGQELEYSRVASLFPEAYLKKGKGKWYIHGLSALNSADNKRELVSRVTVEDSGYVSVSASKDGKRVKDFASVKEVSEKDCLPLTFPALGADAYTEADRVRAQEIADLLGGDFNNALLFINDGNVYTDANYFHQMALALLATADEQTLINGFGTKYKIDWSKDLSNNNYTRLVTITDVSNPNVTSASETFVCAMKKGYKGCDLGEPMENGQKNNIALDGDEYDDVVDTTWISWEHLYLNAEILYCEGVSASNISDVHEDSSVENSVFAVLDSLAQNAFSGITMGDALDRVFNSGTYGTDLYVYGIYKNKVNDTVFTIYLAFFGIVVSLISISVIRLINEHQTTATYNSMSRANILSDIRNMISVLLAIAFSWQIFKLLFMINYYFVAIWAGFLADNYNVAGLFHNTYVANGIMNIAFIIIAIYIEIMYILRSIFIPVLMACSPLFIFLYTLGGNYQRITMAWFKELLGAIFMQSIHAFVLTFVMMIVQSSAGLTQIVVWACIIPLTKMFRDMCGLGGKELFQAAKGLSGTAGATMGTAAGAVGNVAGGVMGAAGGVAGGTLGGAIDAVTAKAGVSTSFSDKLSNIGQGVGRGAGSFLGGAAQAGIGAGMIVSSGGEDGCYMLTNGIHGIGQGIASGIAPLGDVGRNLVRPTVDTPKLSQRNQEIVNRTSAQCGQFDRFNGKLSGSGKDMRLDTSYTPPEFFKDYCNVNTQVDNGVGKLSFSLNSGMSDSRINELCQGYNYSSIPKDDAHKEQKVAAMMKVVSAYNSASKQTSSINTKQMSNLSAQYASVCEDLGISNLQCSMKNGNAVLRASKTYSKK